MPKSESPLRGAQVEGDKLKVKIDEFVAKCKEVLENSGLADKQTQMKEQLKRCKEITNEVTKLEKKVAKLKKSQEPTSVSKFDEKKQDELKRLASFKVQLGKIGDTLEPDEVEEDYFRQVNENNNDEDENDTKEETDESEDSDEESHDATEEGGDDSISSEEPSPANQKPKLGRLGLFRKSSKLKDIRSKVPSKIEEEEDVEEANESKVEESKEEEDEEPVKTEVLSKKEKKVKERREKFLEREAKEKERREKKAKEKLEKEQKEKEKKEQKEKQQMEKKEKAKKEQEEKLKGKTKGKKGKEKQKKESLDDDEDEEEDEEEEDGENESKGEASEDEEVVSEEEENSEEEDEDGEKGSEVVDSKNKTGESKDAAERRGSRSWFFRSKTPDRKQKAEIRNKDDNTSKKKQSSKAQPVVESKEEEDEEGEEDEDEDEEEEEESEYDDDDDDEDGEDDDEEEEEESEEDEIPADSKKQHPQSKPGMGPSVSKPKPSAAVREEEDGESEDDEEDESGEEDEEDDDEEEDDEEEEEEEEEEEVDDGNKLEETGSSDEEGDHPPDGENLFEVLCNFDAEEPTDLSVKQGNVVTILSTREDGWWMAEDEEGNKGLVPSTYLKLKRDSVDYNAVQSPEPEQDENMSPRSGKELWKSVRKSIHETSATDVLTAMGAMPAGFRQSLTARLLKNEQNKLSSFLKPKLSESNLSFKDLLWDPQSSQLRAVPCRIQKMLSVILVRNMPAMGIGLETTCRHARIAIFDGREVLSNIHTMQATWNESDLKTWRFSPKVSGILPSILDGECFIRTERSEKNIGLLIELCVSYVRTKTGEKGEVSCGWVHLPLFSEETGGPILNKVYDLPVNGGTPFEQGVEVDPSISRKASSSKFRSMLTANKQPRLQIKLIAPTKEQKAQLETLPFTIVSVASYLPLLSFYRRILADAILRDRIDVQSTELIHSPLLASFPKAAELPDVMDGLRSMWAEKKRSTKKSEKRDAEQMKSLFTSAYMESAYPVLHSATLPEYRWPDIESEQIRWESISNFTTAVQQKGILTALLSPGKMHTPFHTSEVSFDILGAYTNR